MWAGPLWQNDWVWLQWSVVIGASLAAALCDVGVRKIPNLLTGSVFVAGTLWAMGVGNLGGLMDGLSGCLILALPYVLLFVFAGGGAGDAKLMGALGMWLGVRNGVAVLVSVTLAGAFLAVLFALAKNRFQIMLRNLAQITQTMFFFASGKLRFSDARTTLPEAKSMQAMPYGIAVFVGVCLAAGGTYLWRT